MKIVVGASSFASADQDALELLRHHGCQVHINPYGRKLTEVETVDCLEGAVGLLAGLEPLNRRVLEARRDTLKAVARIGIGLDNVDSEAAAEFGIKVSNTPDGPTQGVAEMTLAALLTICRGLVSANEKMHCKQWDKTLGHSIMGLTILVLGYGRIGRAVSKLFRALGANILVYDPALKDISVKSLEEGLRQAQAVSIHASGEKELIGAKELATMPQGAILLNSARGGLVNETALYDALKSGHLSACWLDVFSEEPYSGLLCDCPNALLTPHLSTYTGKCRKDMEMQAVVNLLRDLNVAV
jgi:D-3-phosphoglycerate dehydrogenase